MFPLDDVIMILRRHWYISKVRLIDIYSEAFDRKSPTCSIINQSIAAVAFITNVQSYR